MATVESMTTIRNRLREQMPVTRRWAYFDHAAVAPIPKSAADAIARWSEAALCEGDTKWLDWSARMETIRKRAASLINADEAEIALVPNTTAGVNIVAEGMPWRSGDNVVIAANEFPTNQYPWINQQRHGVEVRRVEPAGGAIDPNRVAAACDQRTRIVSLSWVGYSTGYRLDPREMAQVAHDAGALFFLDAIQGLGVFPLDVQATDVDFVAADGHKWMLGPEGAGLFYLKREHLELLEPTGLGWHSVVGHSDYSHIELRLRPTAARFEGGSQNMVGFHGFGASLDLLAACGLTSDRSPLADCVLQIAAHTVERLEKIGAQPHSPRDDAHRSGIISFEIPGKDPGSVRKHCLKSGVALAHRDGKLRASPHAYNNEEDVERLIAAVGSA